MTGKEYALALRQIADWYEAHPDAPFSPNIYVGGVHESREQAADLARALGSCRKEHHETTFHLVRDFGGVELTFSFWRATVCDRVVVGTKEIPERIVPAHTEELVEWQCIPLFAEDGTTPPAGWAD